MSFYDNRYYYLTKLLLTVLGHWPFQRRMESYVMLGITVLFLSSLTGFELWGLVAGINNLSIIMENGSPLLVNCMAFIKLINYSYNKNKMRKLLEAVEETWMVIKIGPENEIFRHYAKQSKTYAKGYGICVYMVWIFYCTMPVLMKGLYSLILTNETYPARFLYRLEHILDMDKYYNLLMLHGFIAVFYIACIAIAVDSMFIICLQHACALFELIRYKMERIPGIDIVTLNPNVLNDDAYSVIVECIKIYNRAYKFSELLSSAFATSFLFLLGNIIICLSFNAAELFMVNPQLDEIIRIVASNTAQLSHIFYLSYTCQRLIDHSSDLHEVIYSCNWTSISLRSKKLLIFMLMRAKKPCQIWAGKMYVLSMQNFGSMLQVTMSYITVLTSMQ